MTTTLDIDSLSAAVAEARSSSRQPPHHLELHAPADALSTLMLIWRGVYGGIGNPFGLRFVACESGWSLAWCTADD